MGTVKANCKIENQVSAMKQPWRGTDCLQLHSAGYWNLARNRGASDPGKALGWAGTAGASQC